MFSASHTKPVLYMFAFYSILKDLNKCTNDVIFELASQEYASMDESHVTRTCMYFTRGEEPPKPEGRQSRSCARAIRDRLWAI